MQMFPRHNQGNGSQLQSRLDVVRMIMLFLVGTLVVAAMSFSFSGRTPAAHAATSWNQIWSEDFNGPAGAQVNTSNWLYDIGTGWGTGEIETMTNSTNNVYLDGKGHLVIKPLLANGTWTSGRIESQRSNFAAPVGGKPAVLRFYFSNPMFQGQPPQDTGPRSGCLARSFGWIITGRRMVRLILWRISTD